MTTTFAQDLKTTMTEWDAATPAQRAAFSGAVMRAALGRAWDDRSADLAALDAADGPVCRAIKHVEGR